MRMAFSGAVVIVTACATLLAGCGGDSPNDDERREPRSGDVELASKPSSVAEAREVEYFDKVPDMAGESDMVVAGRVIETVPGRVIGEQGDGDQFQYRSVTIEVTDVITGKNVEPGDALLIEEEGWDPDSGEGYIVNGVAWSQVGDVGVYFLHRKTDPGPTRYRLIYSKGRVLEGADGLEASGNAEIDPGDTESDQHDHPEGDQHDSDGPWQTWDLATLTLPEFIRLLEGRI